MRGSERETLLIVVNFGGSDAEDNAVIIPQHAFDCLGTPQRTYMATDLVSGVRRKINLVADSPICVPLRLTEPACCDSRTGEQANKYPVTLA